MQGGKPGERIEALQQAVGKAQKVRDGLASLFWADICLPYLQKTKNEARDAWCDTAVDNLTDEKIIRGQFAQRGVVKTIEAFVNYLAELVADGNEAYKELEKIKKEGEKKETRE